MTNYEEIKQEAENKVMALLDKDENLKKIIKEAQEGEDYIWTQGGDIVRGALINLAPYESVLDELKDYLYEHYFLLIEGLSYDMKNAMVGEYQGDCVVLHKHSPRHTNEGIKHGPIVWGYGDFLADSHSLDDDDERNKTYQMIEDEMERRGEYCTVLEYNEGFDELTLCTDFYNWLKDRSQGGK